MNYFLHDFSENFNKNTPEICFGNNSKDSFVNSSNQIVTQSIFKPVFVENKKEKYGCHKCGYFSSRKEGLGVLSFII